MSDETNFDPDPEIQGPSPLALEPAPPPADPLQEILAEMREQRKLLATLAQENAALKQAVATHNEIGWAPGVPQSMRRGDPNTSHLTSDNAARRVVIATRASIDDPAGFRDYGNVVGTTKRPSAD